MNWLRTWWQRQQQKHDEQARQRFEEWAHSQHPQSHDIIIASPTIPLFQLPPEMQDALMGIPPITPPTPGPMPVKKRRIVRVLSFPDGCPGCRFRYGHRHDCSGTVDPWPKRRV